MQKLHLNTHIILNNNKMYIMLLILIHIVLSTSNYAIAVGDSAGCSSSNMSVARIAATGTAQQLGQEINRMIEFEVEKKQNKNHLLSVIKKSKFDTRAYKESLIQNIINRPLGCGDGMWLLDYAVAAGNIDTVKYLLDIGASPNATSQENSGFDYFNIFSRCSHSAQAYWQVTQESNDSIEHYKKRAASIALLVKYGANINEANNKGYTALHYCKNPEVIKIYIKNGADVFAKNNKNNDGPPLNEAVYDAVTHEEKYDHGIERAKIFASHGSNNLKGEHIENHVRYYCKLPEKKKICKELSQFIHAPQGVFLGLPKKAEQKRNTTPKPPCDDPIYKLKELYQHVCKAEIAEGKTIFLNYESMLLGSFLRRFEKSVYGEWKYPQEALNKRIEGIIPVKKTFDRIGNIVCLQLLESSGNRILDEEVLRTLKTIRPFGILPKGRVLGTVYKIEGNLYTVPGIPPGDFPSR